VSIAAAQAPASLRALASSTWCFRWRVELEAQARFARLAADLEGLGADATLVALARRASADEARHAVHCARLAAELGQLVPDQPPPPPADITPRGLGLEDAVTYELVAACCITESVSVAVLTHLLPAAQDRSLRAALHELAEDEVRHARLGWAHLAIASRRGRTAFLGPFLPGMLQGTVEDDLFHDGSTENEAPALLTLGVLPHTLQRELFVLSLGEVVFPGLEDAGVDTGAGRAWLATRLQGANTRKN
jgi:hypothetical protein